MRSSKLITTIAIFLAIFSGKSFNAFTRDERRSDDEARRMGTLYTMSNDLSQNEILVFDRHRDGTLSAAGTVLTGGSGTGAGLGSQGSLVLTDDGHSLLAVNAGSNSVSLLEVTERGLRLRDVAASGGLSPISVAVDDDVAYVLNADSDNIAGFRIRGGRIVSLPRSTRALSGTGTGPAEVAFSPDRRLLVVTEKNTNLIDTFRVGEGGLAGPAVSHQSNGETPFGFTFDRRGQLLVTEAFGGAANASAVSSYRTGRDGSVELIDGSVGTHQTAACWVLVTGDGRFAYATNTGSGSISGYAVGRNGSLTLLDADGRTADTGAGSAPIDLASSGDGRFLYSLNSVTDTIGAFRIGSDGKLTALPFVQGLPDSASGLAGR